MKFEIDTEKKTVQVLGEAPIKELMDILEKIGGEWTITTAAPFYSYPIFPQDIRYFSGSAEIPNYSFTYTN